MRLVLKPNVLGKTNGASGITLEKEQKNAELLPRDITIHVFFKFK
jgi:hypothetical protein